MNDVLGVLQPVLSINDNNRPVNSGRGGEALKYFMNKEKFPIIVLRFLKEMIFLKP